MRFSKHFSYRKTEGEVGIEVEVEGKRLPVISNSSWRTVEDGSLRGEAREYVFNGPKKRENIYRVLRTLHKRLNEDESVIVNESNRTSVHVHVNIKDMSIVQVFNYILLYLIFEKQLVHFCGEEREGNLFCLRADDAEYLIDFIEDIAEQGDFHRLETNNIRYASINLAAISKYGSLEFRAMRGTTDIDLIYSWTCLLLQLKDAAKRYKDPLEIVYDMSGKNVESFSKDILGDFYTIVESQNGWQKEVWNSLRKLQTIAFNGDWENFNFIDEPEEDI